MHEPTDGATFSDVERIFEAALSVPAADRESLVAQLCHGNAELQGEVMSLLAADEEASRFLELPAAESGRLETLSPGTRVGQYEIVCAIGAGATGEVYKSVDTRLGRSVALKTLSATLAGRRDALARFTREARAASSLNHPNIVQVYDIGSARPEPGVETIHYIAMELIDGVTLRESLREPGDLRDRLELLVQVAAALEKAHQARIIHRDLKPENIMVAPDRTVKVVDFGLAKLTEPNRESAPQTLQTRAGVVMGTAGYMSPEQVQGHPADHRSDIFSLGCIIHEAATGRGPFAGSGFIDSLHKIVHAPAPRMALFHPRAPRALQVVVDRCLRKDSAERYQSMSELAEALRSVLRKLGTSRVAVPYTGRPRLLRGRRWFTATVAAVAVGVAAPFLVQRMREEPVPQRAVAERPIRSLTVMPFAVTNIEGQYLADGLTEDLIERLSQYEALRVTPKSRAMHYRGRALSHTAVRRELGADAVLKGTVARAGHDVTVAAELIDVRNGHRVWGQTYVRHMDDLPSIQTAIHGAVAERLRLRDGAAGRGVYRQRTNNPAAYDHLLKGRHQWNQWTEAGWRKALQHFEAAAEADPLYSLAYAGISDSWTQLAFYGYTPVAEAWPQAKSAALKAIELDATIGEAHMSLAVVYTWFEHEYAKADQEYRRALALSPNNPEVWLAYSRHLSALRRHDEAVRTIDRAHQLNPVSLIIGSSRSSTYLLAGRPEEALRVAQHLTQVHPAGYDTLWNLGNAYMALRRDVEAVETFLQVDQQSGVPHPELKRRRKLFAAHGLRAYWRAAARWMARQPPRERSGRSSEISRAFALAGEIDSALYWAEKSHADGEPLLLWIYADPAWAPLRTDPRFVQVLRKLRLV